MRYLVEWKLMSVPPEMAKTALALNQAADAWIDAEKKAGCIIEAWSKTEGSGGVAIVERESNDALYQKLMENPYMPFLQYTVTPLTDIKIAMVAGQAFLKKMVGE
jgi:hypothetical protein